MPEFSLCVKKRLHTAGGSRVMNIALEAGGTDFVSLFGPSGAGKTTLLRMIAGLSRPDSGTITFNNKSWFDAARKIDLPPQKRRVGLVFQDFALFPAMTVRRNIEYGVRRPDDRGHLERLMETFDIARLCDRYPDSLSGGQKQRVALARALAPRPHVLLLDEPLSALDSALRVLLQEELARAHRDMPVLTILVTHDVAEIFRLSGAVFVLRDGAIIKSGTPGEVFGAEEDRLRITGQLLVITDQGVMTILTIAVGAEVSRVAVLRADAAGLAIGDRVSISVKAFNPDVRKLLA